MVVLARKRRSGPGRCDQDEKIAYGACPTRMNRPYALGSGTYMNPSGALRALIKLPRGSRLPRA